MTTPAEALATAVGGTVSGPNTITVGALTIAAFPTGQLRILGLGSRGVPLGRWSDAPADLAAEYARIVEAA